MKKLPLCLAALACAAACAAFAAVPDTLANFTASTGAWNDSANWDTSAVPGASGGAVISSGNQAVINDGGSYDIGYVRLDQGTLSISNGTLTITGSFDQSVFGNAAGDSLVYIGPDGKLVRSGSNLIVGIGADSNTTMLIDGGQLESANWVYVAAGNKNKGVASATASLILANGASFVSTANGVGVGRDAGDVGYLSISGNSTMSVASSFSLGDNSNATTGRYAIGYGTISGGAVTAAGQVIVGNNGEGHLTVSGANSYLLGTLDTSIGGGMGAPSTLDILDGATVTLNRNVYIGNYKARTTYGAGKLTVDNAMLSISGTLTVGNVNYDESTDNVSTANITNATLSVGNVNVGSNAGKLSGSIGNWDLQSTGGNGVMTISGSTVNSGALTAGNSGRGLLVIENSTVSMNAATNIVAGVQAYNATPANGELIFFGAGNGTIEINNSTINAPASTTSNNRIYAGQGGTGSITINNSTLSGFDLFSVGNYQYRTMAVNSATFGGSTVSAVSQAYGTFTLNSGKVDMGKDLGTTIELSIGIGGTGRVIVNGGELSTGGSINMGREVALATSVSNGSVMTTGTASLVGTGYLEVKGGVVNATNMYLSSGVASGDFPDRPEKTSVSAATISGGTVNILSSSTSWGNIVVSNNNTFSSATIAFYNGADVNASGNLQVNANGTVIFGLKGGNDAFDAEPILSVNSMVLNTGASYIVDLEGYAATEDMTITLAEYAAKPGNADSIVFEVINLDESSYEIAGGLPQWGDNALTITINYIPEPGAAAGLLGLLALLTVARRRR